MDGSREKNNMVKGKRGVEKVYTEYVEKVRAGQN